MTIFHLQWSRDEDYERLVLADQALPWCTPPHETVEAASWLNAKAKLGYPLSVLQEDILRRREARKAA